ncbi:hypothetical protein B9Q02_08545 [Candidatus Marsarchaeota G1 archaeon BE_D]|uniref:Uncharacterized protein n=2 Tax=Candidatus Marsarchaeota TaxID=1978152 RepID=A0A2R6BZM7_9ARCH|nr:MAG: hypothetical protein B9Q02_08545 [Candidatus Marsarchaeota G1 archaeon BE_D]PSO04069.1 MAG: hypothetical protein B9Q12_03045 [Candidatus Marsarchaeota G2 archaeon ECH_B_SAG-G06]
MLVFCPLARRVAKLANRFELSFQHPAMVFDALGSGKLTRTANLLCICIYTLGIPTLTGRINKTRV